MSGKSTEELEKEFYEAAGIRLGRVEISRNKDRFCFVVPEEGAEYVHEKRSGNSFIKKLVALLQTHPCTCLLYTSHSGILFGFHFVLIHTG